MRFFPLRARCTLPALGGLLISGIGVAATAQAPALPPVDLVRTTVQNEISAINQGAKFMFRNRKETPKGSETKLIIETRDAMAGMLIAINDHPLTPEQRQAEDARVDRFVKDPEELRERKRHEKEESERIGRIMRALPDAFLYEYAGSETAKSGLGKTGNALVRLSFLPNPAYTPPSHVEQVLTGMQGSLLIDENEHRIARIDGTLQKDVGFGWGILGHLDRGGRFLVEQGEVGQGDWEVTHMDLAFTGKILFFKSVDIKSSEFETDFRPVPSDLTFAMGLELLRKHEAMLAESSGQNSGAPK
jgi:hypothetical protein